MKRAEFYGTAVVLAGLIVMGQCDTNQLRDQIAADRREAAADRADIRGRLARIETRLDIPVSPKPVQPAQ